MNDQTSSNEAKTPLANVSSGKVNSLKADWYHLDDNCLGHYDGDNGRDCRAIADIINPTTQDCATASAPTTSVTDHDVVGSGLPESASSIPSVVTEIRERRANVYRQQMTTIVFDLMRDDLDRLLSIIDRLQSEKDDRLAQLLYTRNERDQGSARIRELLQERDSAASNMRDEIVKRVKEKSAFYQSRNFAYEAMAMDKLATELEAIEVKDDPGR